MWPAWIGHSLSARWIHAGGRRLARMKRLGFSWFRQSRSQDWLRLPGQWLSRGRDGLDTATRFWRQSLAFKSLARLKASASGLRQRLDILSVSQWWRPVLEAFIVLYLVFLPLIGSWPGLIPFLFLYYGLMNPVKTCPTPGIGWLGVLWFVGAVFSAGGLGQSWQRLLQLETWLLLAWATGLAFHVRLWEKVMRWLAATSPLWMAMGFRQYLSGVPTAAGWLSPDQAQQIPIRVYSLFGNPIYYALYLLIVMVLCDRLFRDARKLWQRLAWLAIGCLAALSLYFTYSRAAWLSGGFLLLLRFRKKLSWRYLTMGGLFLLLLLSLPDFRARIGSLVTLGDSSLRFRWRIWEGVARAIPDFWLWGAGPGRFEAVYPWFMGANAEAGHAHQWYLQLWLEHGLVGLLGMGLLLRERLLRLVGLPELMKTAAVAAFVFLLYGCTESWDVHPVWGGYFWFLVGLTFAHPIKPRTIQPEE